MQNLIAVYKTFFSENRKWLRGVYIWFVVSAAAGVIFYFVYPQLLEEILKVFEEKFGTDPALDFDLVMEIFFNNLIVSIAGIIGGLLFGVGPFVIIAVNGFLIGFIVTAMIAIGWADLLNTVVVLILSLVPHGIVEIPAFLFSAALGLRLGLNWLSQEAYGQRFKVLKNDLKSVMILLPGIVLLLFIAALIEVYITGNLTQ